MIVIFNIEYHTGWGEKVFIAEIQTKPISMYTTDGINWSVEIDLDIPDEGKLIYYNYQIEQNGIVTRKEWNSLPRCIFLSGIGKKKYRIYDSWKNNPEQSYFYSSAFTDILLAHTPNRISIHNYTIGIIIKTYSPCIGKDYTLAISGNQKILGSWDPDKALQMSDATFPEWQIELDADKIKFPLEYKFILYSKLERKAVCWENNPNRYLANPELKSNETLVISDRYTYFNLPVGVLATLEI